LALAMDIHQTTASNLVKTLRSKELISLSKDEQDRRSVQLHILPAGLALLGRVSGPFEGVLPEALAKLQPVTLARMDQDLGELIKLLKADDAAAGIPLSDL
jgi:DNA-binding MarR family transcriptional regulator